MEDILMSFIGLLGIEAGDTTAAFALKSAVEIITNYCNIDEIPEGLQTTAIRMATDIYRLDKPGEGNAPLQVSSISAGDTSTSFQSSSDALAGSILKDYKRQLNRYRRLAR